MGETRITAAQRRSSTERASAARTWLVVVHGAAFACNAWMLSRWAGGLFGAALFLLAVTLATLTIGIAAAALVGRWEDRSLPARPALHGAATIPCTSCGGGMVASGPGWICELCDR